MFGYISINKQEMKFKEFDLYQSYYCGFCQELKHSYGKRGQLTLSYDLTFLILMLTSLYEPDTATDLCRCIAHPFKKHLSRSNEFSRYAADMNLLLSYYKCEDDWMDEKKLGKKAFAILLKKKVKRISEKYPQKAQVISQCLSQIQDCEKNHNHSHSEEDSASAFLKIDEIAGYFGDIMAEIFASRQDEWEKELRRIGFFMGKFIYLMDAYEDVEKDAKKGNFNPFSKIYETEQFEEKCEQILTMMMAECSRSFEKLPLLKYTEILRNILYSGVWCRYEMVLTKRKEKKGKKDV